MTYTKDNINNLTFKVHHSILNMLNEDEDILYKIEYDGNSDYCIIHWTEENRPIKTKPYDYLLIIVLNYLNSGDWVVFAPEKK